MTITANDRRKDYVANGATTTFNGPRAFQDAHIAVLFGVGDTYAVVPKSQYTTRGLGTAGTTIQFAVAPAAGLKVRILRTVPLDQPTDITNQGAFLPEIHENAFDYRVMQLQQLADSSMVVILDPDSGEFVWDAKGSRIINVGDAKASMDAMNLRSVLLLIEQIQGGGGTTGVTPKVWSWEGDGESTDFPLDGADVFDPLFYDTAMEATAGAADYLVVPPDAYTIVPATADAPPVIRFPVPPAEGIRGFTVLRGYARPWIGQTPIYTVAPNIITNITGDTIIGAEYHNALIVISSADDVTLTIRANTGSDTDWKRGQFFSALQLGTGKVRIAIEAGGEVLPPDDFTNETRARGSVISATCYAADSDAWVSSGDLLRLQASPDIQSIRLDDRSVLIGTNIATGTGKAVIQLPYGLKLRPIADGGVYATLAVAQAAGTPVAVDVNRNGASIFSTTLTFDNAEKTTRTAATPAVFAVGGDLLSAGDEISIDVDAVGTELAKGLSVYLVGERI